MFSQNETRRPPTGARMQNGKLDLGRNDASWLGMGAGAAPGLPAAPSRTGPSFAQTIGGQQHRPLDPSEFPTLGGNQQGPQPPSSFAPNTTSSWAANTIRQRSPERRLTGYGRGAGPRPQDESTGTNYAPGGEGYRFGSGQTNQTATRGGRPAGSPFPAQQEQEPVSYQSRMNVPEQSALSSDGPASPLPTQANQAVSSKRLSEMTDQERFGMAGLVARLNPSHPDYNPMLNGFDLTKLGLNLDSPDPILPTWGGPFDDTNMVIPDFTLPAAYTVSNVPPLATKMEAMSDETLIMIFYQHPRDQLQELAAQQLFKRDWRWHKVMHMWMQKDVSYGVPPYKLGDKMERGMYIFFDINNWRRERKEIVLNYDDLDTRSSLSLGVQGVGAGGGAAAAAAAAAAANGQQAPSAAVGVGAVGAAAPGPTFGGAMTGGLAGFQSGLNNV